MDVEAKRCKLQVWDTAGQDRFKCVVSSFYRGAHGVMICFDITNLESFRNVDNWLEEVKRYCSEQTPVFLVGTKSDLQSKRAVSYSTIKTYIEQKNLSYIETSSKTNENIENCFINFTKTLVVHTNQMEIDHKIKQTQKSQFDLTQKTKPVTNGGCMGVDKCNI
jgi:Ras-related protein Rab-1A